MGVNPGFPRRLPDQPPADSLAESMVLNAILLNPSLLGTIDVGSDLVFPEHRDCWQAMLRVHQRIPNLEAGPFLAEWLHELATEDKTALVDVLDLAWYELGGRPRFREQEEDPDWIAFAHGRRRTIPPYRPLSYWLDRVRACAEARRLISAAQEMAERAWKVDTDGAAAVATQVAERQRSRVLRTRLLNV